MSINRHITDEEALKALAIGITILRNTNPADPAIRAERLAENYLNRIRHVAWSGGRDAARYYDRHAPLYRSPNPWPYPVEEEW